MQNKVSYYAITTTYVGTMFGAGFVSGQEILQFFGCDPKYGIFGAIILGILVALFSYLVMYSSYLSKPKSFEQLIIGNNRILKYIINFLFLFFSCGILIIMFAGAGALLNTLFNFPKIIGSLLMALVVLFIGLNDTTGIIKAFKVLTPIMFIIALTTSLLGLRLDNITDVISSIKLHCPGNKWWFSAILYMAYNYFLAIAILMPLGKEAKSKKDILIGALLSGFILFLVSITMIFTLLHNIDLVSNVEMPMLAIAQQISPLMANIYAFVLLGGLFSASIGMIFAILNYFKSFNNKYFNNKKITIPIICLIALSLSNFGFSYLISIVYPILGYVGLVAMIGVIINFIRNTKRS